MTKCNIYPEKIAKLSKEQMQTLIASMLQHISRSFTYSTGPVELSNRILTELVKSDLIDIKDASCGGCTSCTPPPKAKRKPKTGKPKEGNIIKFPTKE